MPADAGDAKREWETLLLTFNIEEQVAIGLINYLVDTEGLESFYDFRCNFRETSDFKGELVVKAEMPDGATEISQPGRWAARMRQVWEAIIQVHQVQQSIKSEGTEGIKLDELLDVSDIMISGIGFGIS